MCSCQLIANLLQGRDDDDNWDDDVKDDYYNGCDNDGDNLNDDDVSTPRVICYLR